MFQNLKNIGAFLVSRRFLTHFGLALLAILVLYWITMFWLRSYTRHGDQVAVPSVIGLPVEQAESVLGPKGLQFFVDSVSTDKFPKGTIIGQNPLPTDSTGLFVKEGRTIYLTVVSRSPLMVTMPNLVYKSKKHAEGILKIVGLKVKYSYKPYADCKDCVIEQKFKKHAIAAGEKVEKGSTIELVLGQGQGGAPETVPDLVGLTIDAANSRLNTVSLSLFSASCEGCVTRQDSLAAKIYRQEPSASSEAAVGSEVTVWRRFGEIPENP
jgi:beta-lactam-binding protein with PASTA domain